MHCSLKSVIFALCLALATVGAFAKDKTKSDKPKDSSEKKGDDKKKGDKKKGKDSDSKDDKPADGTPGKMSIPMVENQPSKGVKIPYFGPDGKLQMSFNIVLATKTDPDHMRMQQAQVETFTEDGASEMVIDLPESVLDLNTRVITTNKHVMIKRSDFQIEGQTMEFNTETKQGTLGGHVRMLIYNLNEEDNAKPEPKTDE